MNRRLSFPVFVIIFAAAYSIIYVLAVEYNWALFTYAPATGALAPLLTPAAAGPTMYWYGWLATSAIGGAVVAVIAALLPAGVARRIPAALCWAVPIAMLLVIAYLLRGYFLR
jgi:hypothetical protein